MGAMSDNGISRSRKKSSSRGHHRFVGVRQRPSGRWVAEIKDSLQKVRLWLGTYDTAEDAARAYDNAARALRGSNARTNFELPESASSGGANKRGGSQFVPECTEPFSFEDVNEPGSDAEGLLGALKAKLLDGKKGKFDQFQFLGNSAAQVVQSGMVSRSSQNCSGKKELLLPIPSSSANDTVLTRMNYGTGTSPVHGVMSTLASSNTCANKSVVIPNHDYHEGAVASTSSGRVNSHQLCQTPPVATWPSEVAYDLPWPTQYMSQVLPDNGLLASSSTAAATLTNIWPLSGVIESTVDMTCMDQGPSSSNKSGQMMNMVSMQLPLVGGANEGLWTLEQQQFVQCDQNNSWFSFNGSWDPLLYLKMRSTCDEWKPFIVMIAIDFSFAAVNILLKKVLEEGMNHLVFITYRLSIATIFIAPICYFRERNDRPRLTFRILCYLFCSAIVGASVTQYFFLMGIQYTSATFSCAFINMVPVVTFMMALPFGLETVKIKCKSGRAKILGSLVCIGGALMLTLYKGKPLFNFSHYESVSPVANSSAVNLASTRTKGKWTIGVIALVLGTIFWSSWFILQSKISKRYPCQYSSTAIMSFFGAIQSAVICFFTDHNLSIWVLKGKIQIIAILYAGMIGSGLCFVGMSWCVKKRGPVFTAAFSPLVQIMAAMIDIPVLHEQLHLGSVMGSILVIIGLYILLWGKSMEMQNRVVKLVQEAEETKEQEPQPQIQQLTVYVHAESCDSQCH
ncbi:hypothetical protein JHK86_037229 [Glycine max]|nr:hypothetical protein JHK86_037229 [Glycine max]